MAKDWIKITCPNCGAVGRAKREGAQVAVRCPQCMAICRVADDEVSSAVQTIDKRGRPIRLPTVHRENVGVEVDDREEPLGLIRDLADAPAPPSPEVRQAYEEAGAARPPENDDPFATERPATRNPKAGKLDNLTDLGEVLDSPTPAAGQSRPPRKAQENDESGSGLFRAHEAIERRAQAIWTSKTVWLCVALLAAGAAWKYWPRSAHRDDPELRERVGQFLTEFCKPTGPAYRFRPFVQGAEAKEFLEWLPSNSPAGLLGSDQTSKYKTEILSLHIATYGNWTQASLVIGVTRERPGHEPAQTRVNHVWKQLNGKWFFDTLMTSRTTRPS